MSKAKSSILFLLYPFQIAAASGSSLYTDEYPTFIVDSGLAIMLHYIKSFLFTSKVTAPQDAHKQ